MSGYLSRQVLVFLVAPIPVAIAVILIVGFHWSAPAWMILTGAVAGVASLLLGLTIQPSPLPPGLRPDASARRSLHRFRQITHLRLALPMVAIALGAGGAILGGGLSPFVVALVLAWPQVALAWPSFHAVAKARRGMEAWGSRAYLWAGLAQPAPGTRPAPRRPAEHPARTAKSEEAAKAAPTTESATSTPSSAVAGTSAPSGKGETGTSGTEPATSPAAASSAGTSDSAESTDTAATAGADTPDERAAPRPVARQAVRRARRTRGRVRVRQ